MLSAYSLKTSERSKLISLIPYMLFFLSTETIRCSLPTPLYAIPFSLRYATASITRAIIFGICLAKPNETGRSRNLFRFIYS
ncbi:hypothetical protein BDF22DRAFT_672433 [Syncephalis plumigaleata]|nr:hypothetical protein BDF22DRAFT_672433 [Syncephalis plumigaleata]